MQARGRALSDFTRVKPIRFMPTAQTFGICRREIVLIVGSLKIEFEMDILDNIEKKYQRKKKFKYKFI